MSMLAERKRKQKWCLNPRGKYWSEDSNKLGQKLLEKMGWSAGKGLGAKEDGITEHIRVNHKNDSKGMGYKETDDQWTQHDSNFSQLLTSLSGLNGNDNIENVNKIELESLEKKSENSRARVHYRKFTRGKDLSRYSEKDLANIFGRKNLRKEKNSRNSEVMQEVIEENTKSFGVETHNKGSMIDYFKKKMLNNKYIVNKEIDSSKIKTYSDEDVPSFGFGFHREDEKEVQSKFLSYISENIDDNITETGESKKQKGILKQENNLKCALPPNSSLKRKTESELELAFTPLKKKFKNFESLNSLQDDEIIEKTPKKKCKKKKVKSNHLGQKQDALDKFEIEGRSNPAFDPGSNTIVVENHVLNIIKEENEDIQNDSPEKKPEYHDEIKEIPIKRKNKKSLVNINSKGTEIVCPGLDEASTNMDKDEEFYLENKSRKKIKSKSKKGNDNSCFEDSTNNSLLLIGEVNPQAVEFPNSVNNSIQEPNKKNKKSKKVKNGCHIENTIINENVRTLANDMNHMDSDYTNSEQKDHAGSMNILNIQKKIKRKNNNNCFQNYLENIQIQEFDANLHSSEQKASKTKKRKRDKSGAIANPCFNPDESTDCAENSKTSSCLYEVKRKNKEVHLGIDNAGLDLSSPPHKKCKVKQIKPPLELEMPVMDEIMLNVVDTPILKKSENDMLVQKRKTVRFSAVNQRIFINNADSPADLLKSAGGVYNEGYDELGNHIEENIDTLSKQLDDFQAEVENDMNQAKFEVMVGEMGDPHGENEILPDGDVKLKFKYANFGKTPPWARKSGNANAKSSYRHLIKGDIILGFKNTNLHEIKGYDQIRQLEKS